MTRTPVRFSLVWAVTRSKPACALPKRGMLISIMEKTAKKRSGMATANTNAQRQSMKNARIIAPNTMKGLRRSSRRPMFNPVCT